jgi:hypothetical protein
MIHWLHKDGNLQWNCYTKISIRAMQNLQAFYVSRPRKQQRNACFGRRNVRRSLGCFSFCFHLHRGSEKALEEF